MMGTFTQGDDSACEGYGESMERFKLLFAQSILKFDMAKLDDKIAEYRGGRRL